MTHKSFLTRMSKNLQDLVISRSSILYNMVNVAWDHVLTGEIGVNGIFAVSLVVVVSRNELGDVKMEKWAILDVQI